MNFYKIFLVSIFFLLAGDCLGQVDLTQDKKGFHLFNRTPESLMRPLHTDRPDVTETPYTVDAGRFQFEFDFLNFYRHKIASGRRESDFLFINGIAKVGLTNRVDFEVVFSAYEWHRPDGVFSEPGKMRQGFGDVGFRTKVNLIGNDVETFGLAIMPSFLVPSRSSVSENLYVPGLTLIWAKALPNDFEMGGQFEYFHLLDTRKTVGREFWGTFEIGKDLNDKWGVFTEYVSILSPGDHYIHTLNGGIIRYIHSNLHIDIAGHIGLNRFSPSSLYTGFSYRF
jgi:hypothetical protein